MPIPTKTKSVGIRIANIIMLVVLTVLAQGTHCNRDIATPLVLFTHDWTGKLSIRWIFSTYALSGNLGILGNGWKKQGEYSVSAWYSYPEEGLSWGLCWQMLHAINCSNLIKYMHWKHSHSQMVT